MIRNSKGQFIGGTSYWKGKKFTPEMKANLSKIHRKLYEEGAYVPSRLGLEAPNKGKTHLPDEKNPAWKGNNVGYHGLHNWISRKLGKPNTCTDCGKTGLSGRKIHWANISGEYKRDLSDWVRLCAKCHALLDKDRGFKAWETRRKLYGNSGTR